jgi:hypothetical protein
MPLQTMLEYFTGPVQLSALAVGFRQERENAAFRVIGIERFELAYFIAVGLGHSLQLHL